MAPAIGLRQPASYRASNDVHAPPPDDFGRSLPSSAREWQTTHASPAAPARRRSQVNARGLSETRRCARAQARNCFLFRRRTSPGAFVAKRSAGCRSVLPFKQITLVVVNVFPHPPPSLRFISRTRAPSHDPTCSCRCRQLSSRFVPRWGGWGTLPQARPHLSRKARKASIYSLIRRQMRHPRDGLRGNWHVGVGL